MTPSTRMSDANDIFAERAAAKTNRELPGRSLRIAVLGPNLDELRDAGTLKRYQIRDALADLGHSPFFPEDVIDSSSLNWIGQERDLLAGDEVDLIIILHTNDSWGVFGEIANFVSVPQIRTKTAVFFPIEHYTPTRSMPANIIQNYLVKMPYTDDHMRACQLVSDCEKWAQDMQNGYWPSLDDRFAQSF